MKNKISLLQHAEVPLDKQVDLITKLQCMLLYSVVTAAQED